jgi:hypothetical protein
VQFYGYGSGVIGLAELFAFCAAIALIFWIVCAIVGVFVGRTASITTDHEITFRTTAILSLTRVLLTVSLLLFCLAMTVVVGPEKHQNSPVVSFALLVLIYVLLGGAATLCLSQSARKELRCDLQSKTYSYKEFGVFGQKSLRGSFSDFQCVIRLTGPKAFLRWAKPSGMYMLIYYISPFRCIQRAANKFMEHCKNLGENLGIPVVDEWQ